MSTPGTVKIPSAGKSSSSGAGLSYWKPFLGCAERAALERDLGMEMRSQDPETGERKMKKASWNSKKMVPVLDQAKIGVQFHAIREHARKHGAGCDCVFEYQDGNDDFEWAEATDAWLAYKVNTVPMGKCIAMEQYFSFGCKACWEGTCDKVRTDIGSAVAALFCDAGRRCWETVGLPYFTGRIDEVVEADCQEFIDYWVARGAPSDLAIGDIVLLDTKTKTRHEGYLVQQYTNDPQFALYMAVHNAKVAAGEGPIWGNKPVRGMLADIVICTKEKELLQFWVPVSEAVHMVARDEMIFGYAMSKLFGDRFRNPTHCFDYFKICPFFNRQCDRRNHWDEDALLTLIRR